jgi:hypothetical protein
MARIVKGFYVRLVIIIILWLAHVFFEGAGTAFPDNSESISITYWAGIIYLMYFSFYLMRLKCNSCGEPVIYKTVYFSGWRLPKSHCSNVEKNCSYVLINS